jgi:hypothetical protein
MKTLKRLWIAYLAIVRKPMTEEDRYDMSIW